MRIVELLERQLNPSVSFEVIPPPRGRSIRDIIEMVDALMPVEPLWFDVTSHASTSDVLEDSMGNLKRRTLKKRPGTLGICGVIKNRYKVETVAHLLCLGFTREETEDALIELHYLGVENILALRGDGPNYEKKFGKDKSFNVYAVDMVRQVTALRSGQYLQELQASSGLDFCIGVAGYPEKHFEAPHLDIDVRHLKNKVETGAEYIVTQMFFDNQRFYDFVQKCRDADIVVPIIPGLKVLRSSAQLRSIPKTFHVDIPPVLANEFLAHPEHAEEIGARWAKQQMQDLLEHGFEHLHFFVMNDASQVCKLIKSVC